jgi:DNA polymerase III alpha subunit
MSKTEEKFAIRFGLGALKAVGFNMMEVAIKERTNHGKFKDLYDFTERLDPKSINKKSIEALAKAGAFDTLHDNRCQIAESFDILSSYANKKKEEATSSQMSLFGDMPELNKKPELRKVSNWNKIDRLQKEFEAFGFFLNEHPVDDKIPDLRKRGVIFSDKLERDELDDNSLIKMAGVVAGSKHRSSARGRFAYLYISDPFGIFEAMVFDEALITAARDILADGSIISLECLIRKDEGGIRILVRDVKKLDDFINATKPQDKDFEDIKKQVTRNYKNKDFNKGSNNNFAPKATAPTPAPVNTTPPPPAIKRVFAKVEIIIKSASPIPAIKSLLDTCLAKEGSIKTKIMFFIMEGGKVMKIELPSNYAIDSGHIAPLKAIGGVIDVEFS